MNKNSQHKFAGFPENGKSNPQQYSITSEAITKVVIGILLKTVPEIQSTVDMLLESTAKHTSPKPAGPLLLGMGEAATYLGVSRSTLWRLIRGNVLTKIELSPGMFRVRRIDLERLAGAN